MRPFFGYHMPSFSFPGVPPAQLASRVIELAQAAESAGFDLVTVMDHFYQIGGVGNEDEPMLEAYTTLGALAARTQRVRLGAMVTSVTYRNPALLAKMVTTLDVLSGGRAVLGIGAGSTRPSTSPVRSSPVVRASWWAGVASGAPCAWRRDMRT
jgi:alkanesulfonate monooxygenase SsuD/methylene tetrahydromethanopterin reductase-like flavin-dependent oxidoreductase (luciferase family)